MPGERKLHLKKRKGITMIHTILQSRVLLYLMTATGLLGLLCQIIANRCYRQFIREAADVQPEKGEFMKRMRYRYQIDSRCCGGNVNMPVFVQKMLMDYKYKRLTLHQWKRQALGWYLGAAAIAAAGIRYYQLQNNQSNLTMMVRGIAAITVLTAGMLLWCDSRYKEKKLLIQMQDYLSHSGIATDAGEAALEEWKEAQEAGSNVSRRKQESRYDSRYESKAQREKRQLQESLGRMKAGEKETAASTEKDWNKERNREILKQMDEKEQERIIREVLTEFLA